MPPEELRSSDEEAFKEAERRVRRKSEKLDPPYGGEERLPSIAAKARFWEIVSSASFLIIGSVNVIHKKILGNKLLRLNNRWPYNVRS